MFWILKSNVKYMTRNIWIFIQNAFVDGQKSGAQCL
jgi:hypothetical protein